MPAAQSSGGLLPLQRAIALGDAKSLQVALSSGEEADVNSIVRACNAFGETLLHTAVLHQQLAAVQLLLQHGASPLARLPDNPNLRESESTLESTAPRTTNFRYSLMLDPAEATPLHYACAAGHLDTLKLLLSCASPLNDVPKRWRPGSLLLWAITSAQPQVVEFLVLQSRLEADCFDEDGNNSVAITALVLATPETPERLATLKRILQLLLRRDLEDGGADVNHKNMYGLTAFDVAETPAAKQILAQLGAMTARIVPVERVLRWDRDRYRDEISTCLLLDAAALCSAAMKRRLTLTSFAQFLAHMNKRLGTLISSSSSRSCCPSSPLRVSAVVWLPVELRSRPDA